MRTRPLSLFIATMLAALGVVPVHAQSLGTLRWQLQPFCNVITVNVTQSGAVYTLDGFDDQCGAPTRAPLVGLATPNPDGTIGFGFHVVTTPAATPVAVRASIGLATIGGPWSDSAGNAGSLVLNGAAAGSPRPAAVASFPAGIATGGSRITNVGAPVQATDATTKAYVDAAVPPPGAFTFGADGAFASVGSFGAGSTPVVSGAGMRMIWIPGRAAFRAGGVNGTQWDAGNVGTYSLATGWSNVAVGFASSALGLFSSATGTGAVAAGESAEARGQAAVALGYAVGACGTGSVALGNYASTSSIASYANLIPCGGTNHSGAFVFSSSSGTGSYFTSVANEEFAVRAAGGVRLRTNNTASTGCNLAAGSGTWTCTSDRNQKDGFEPVDGDDVLRKLAAMPIDRWSYKTEPGVRHVGPTAQDFRAAFGLGVDDTSIGHIDLSGIGLRAIQALEARTRPLADELAELRAEVAELRRALAAARER